MAWRTLRARDHAPASAAWYTAQIWLPCARRRAAARRMRNSRTSHWAVDAAALSRIPLPRVDQRAEESKRAPHSCAAGGHPPPPCMREVVTCVCVILFVSGDTKGGVHQQRERELPRLISCPRCFPTSRYISGSGQRRLRSHCTQGALLLGASGLPLTIDTLSTASWKSTLSHARYQAYSS